MSKFPREIEDFGNVFQADDYNSIGGGVENGAEFGQKDEGGGAGYSAGHRYNPLIINNNMGRLGGGSLNAFDAGMDDAYIWYNVIRDRCDYDGGGARNGAIAADCGAQVRVNSTPPAVPGASISWQNNDVGVDDRTNGAPMPSAPGMTTDPGLEGGSTPFPYIGADMGPNGGAGSGCLPARWRFNGGSC